MADLCPAAACRLSVRVCVAVATAASAVSQLPIQRPYAVSNVALSTVNETYPGISAGGASGCSSDSAPRASVETFGSHSNQLGRYQFQSPSSFIVAGSSTARTTVASSSTATASPTPIIFMSTNPSVAKIAKTATMTTAALVTTLAVERIPWETACSVVMPLS